MTERRTPWVTATALKALADHTIVEGGMFTAGQLAEWTRRDLTTAQRVNASTRLCALGFVRHQVRLIDDVRTDTYTVTAEGSAAIEAAASGLVRKSGPKVSRAPNPVRPDDLSTRLWHLVRMRKVVDSDSAARILCNAGDEAAYKRTRDTVRKTLRRWSIAGALQEAAKRVRAADEPVTSQGSKRYVLLNDSGPTPPRWRPALKAQQGSQAGHGGTR